VRSLVLNLQNSLCLKEKEQGRRLKSLIVRLFLSSSSISSTPLQSQPSTPPLHIVVQQGIGTSTSSSQPLVTSSVLSSISSPTMAQRPWNHLRAVIMAAPLSQFLAHPEKWLPKFNPDTGILAKEHINNFMLLVNLKGVTEEDAVVRLFPYTFQGAAGPWYFSLPLGSIISWNIFQQ